MKTKESDKLHEMTDGELTQVVGGRGSHSRHMPCSKQNLMQAVRGSCLELPSGPCEYLCINGNVCTCGEDASRGSFTLPVYDPIECKCSPNAR